MGSSFGAGVAVEVALSRPAGVRSLLLAPHGGSMLTERTPAIARAVAVGAIVTMPASDTFWVMRYGRVRDPYGYVWAFGAPLPLGI